jgi:DeoR/GlpR family transcriptional regulator of sugar metabolism
VLDQERGRRVGEFLRSHGTVEVNHLAEESCVLPRTIRRYLKQPQDDGLLVRTWGGAFSGEPAVRETKETLF